MPALKRRLKKWLSCFKSSPHATAGASPALPSVDNLSAENQLTTKLPLGPSSKSAPASTERASAPSPDQAVASAAPTKSQAVGDTISKDLDTTASELAQPPPSASSNTALQKAIEKHTANLSEHEKRSYLEAFGAIRETELLRRIKSCDQDHTGTSGFRQHADRLEGIFGVLDRFLKIVSPSVSASPEATIAVGAIRAVLDIALNFLGFYWQTDKYDLSVRRMPGLPCQLLEDTR
jgi:hypothetical protein